MMDAIIVNHNSGEALDRCLASILPQADGVVVVDNDSAPEGFEAVVRRHSANPKLRVLRAGRNTGFSAGCNLGAAASRADQLLFLNPDCIAAPRLVKTLKGFLEKNPEAGIAGGLLLGEDAREQGGGRRSKPGLRRAFVRASGLWRWTRRGDFHLERQGPPAAPQEVDAVSGACLAIRRSVFEKLGGFDEGYFLHCEDLDLCASAREAGWRVVSVPGAVVFHTKGVCGRSKPLFVEWHKHRGMVRYDRKHHRALVHRALRPAVHTAVWMRFALVCAGNLAARKTPPASPVGSGPTPAKPESIGLLGASSFVGRELLPLARAEGLDIAPFSRDPARHKNSGHWHSLSAGGIFHAGAIARWIALCPITALADALPLLELAGVRRLVAVSSTSRFTKLDSPDPSERQLARDLERAESSVTEWAARREVRLVVLRTTLVYDGLRDANIAAMGRFIRRFQMLPVLFPACGLRQPLHARDLAAACLAALRADGSQNAYNLSGGESLPYLEMAGRVFDASGIPRRFPAVPRTLLRLLEAAGQVSPPRLRFPAGVFHRMNSDMVFDHTAAARDLNFRPRGFRPGIDFTLERAKAR
jgi:GT2 family glycosyltransferase/nucleoside-diphosphate-sugar epimerase